jgi:hypothetical protein
MLKAMTRTVVPNRTDFAGLAIGATQLTKIVEQRYRRFDRDRAAQSKGIQFLRICNNNASNGQI